jgi:hypothetical protein
VKFKNLRNFAPESSKEQLIQTYFKKQHHHKIYQVAGLNNGTPPQISSFITVICCDSGLTGHGKANVSF